jgi:hypothetical protein
MMASAAPLSSTRASAASPFARTRGTSATNRSGVVSPRRCCERDGAKVGGVRMRSFVGRSSSTAAAAAATAAASSSPARTAHRGVSAHTQRRRIVQPRCASETTVSQVQVTHPDSAWGVCNLDCSLSLKNQELGTLPWIPKTLSSHAANSSRPTPTRRTTGCRRRGSIRGRHGTLRRHPCDAAGHRTQRATRRGGGRARGTHDELLPVRRRARGGVGRGGG